LISAAIALGACGGHDDYPASVQRNFLDSCQSHGGTGDGCNCALDKLQDKLSYEDFKKEETAMLMGNPPSRKVSDAVADCR
jgi:hypothetical protein